MMQAQDIRELLLTHYHIRGDITTLDSEWGGTFRITAPGGESYLLKIAPGSVKNARTLMEISVIDKLDKCQLPVAIPRIIRTVTSTTYIETDHGIARLYNWIEGRLWNELNPKSPAALYSLGSGIGYLHKCLMPLDYEAAHDEFLWSPECAMQIQAASLKIDPAKKLWLDAAVKRYTGAHSIIGSLRHCLNYNDANDFNIIVSDDRDDPHVKGFIDFGDLISGPSVLDLAVCIAYATLDLPDPVGAAAEVVKGYNSVLPLSEDEIEAIVPLASARLALSVYHAYHRIFTDPSNDYWQVSSEPAWRLLEKLYHTDDYLALCRIREACGMEPSPQNKSLTGWLKSNYSDIYPITGSDLSSVDVKIMDWSVGSPELGGLDSLNNVPEMTRDTFMNIEEAGAFAGIGRYDEPRIVYTTPAYELEGNNGPEMRTIHIGIDIFLPPGSPLYAPLDGIIHTITDNAGPKEYGPLIILQHKIEEENLIFYTLYGHNSRACLNWHKEGDIVKKGDKIAEIGDYPENGGWVPHVHFQIMSDLLGYRNDYPGVALASQRKVWLSICPDPNLMLGIGNAALQVAPRSTERILQRRRNLLGANLGVSYSSPLHIVRGWKTRLFSADGTAYLDTVNNISHVGHEHPRIVAAASRQSAVLNTNTRYLHTAILDLAEELLATLPDQFTRMYFVNSGSEANDLALRVARHFTGTPQTLVMHEAYHGITQSCLDVSPHKFLGSGGSGRPGYVCVLPDTLHQDEHQATNEAAALANTFDTPFVFIHETLPSCAGQVIPPSSYFRTLYSITRSKGGVCIADEVQTGLGRTGSAFWAFELYDILPDIVTIGKPLGNGHPIGAVALTERIYQSFDNGMEFFSSFGGNPVSCITALNVLRTVREEALQQNALRVGNDWISRLIEFQKTCAPIRDVRGHGLFIGIEICNPVNTKTDRELAQYIQQRMLDHRILTSLDGPAGNVIKIKPPLCFSNSEVDYFNSIFYKILKEDFCQY